jgi:hypothetical protein
MSEGMQLAALRHTEMARELSVIRAAESSVTELALRWSPNDTIRMEVVGELIAEFQKLKEQCPWLERPTMSICDLLLGAPPSWARLADQLDEPIGMLTAKLAAQWEVGVELESLQTLAMHVWDLVLDNVDGSSSLAASMSTVVELLEGWIDATATNGVY